MLAQLPGHHKGVADADWALGRLEGIATPKRVGRVMARVAPDAQKKTIHPKTAVCGQR